jgi:ribose transport system permease protein
MTAHAGEAQIAIPRIFLRRERLHRHAKTLVAWVLLAILITLGSILSSTFRSQPVLLETLKGASFVGIASAAQFFVVVSGGIDLSIASVATVSGMAAAVIMNGQDQNLPYAILASLGIGLVIGTINGLMVNVLKIAPFVATFGMFYILQGAAYTYSVNPVGQASPSFYNLYVDTWSGVPVILVIVGVFWLICWYVARQTSFGRHLYAIGGDRPAARLAGVRTVRVSIAAYITCSVIAAFAGMLELTQTSVGTSDLGATLLLTTVTTVVIGGVSLFGGQGSVIGVLGGVLVLSFLNELFDAVQVNALYQQLIQGLIILSILGIYRKKRT